MAGRSQIRTQIVQLNCVRIKVWKILGDEMCARCARGRVGVKNCPVDVKTWFHFGRVKNFTGVPWAMGFITNAIFSARSPLLTKEPPANPRARCQAIQIEGGTLASWRSISLVSRKPPIAHVLFSLRILTKPLMVVFCINAQKFCPTVL